MSKRTEETRRRLAAVATSIVVDALPLEGNKAAYVPRVMLRELRAALIADGWNVEEIIEKRIALDRAKRRERDEARRERERACAGGHDFEERFQSAATCSRCGKKETQRERYKRHAGENAA